MSFFVKGNNFKSLWFQKFQCTIQSLLHGKYKWEIKFFLGDSVSLCPFLLYQSKSLGNFWTISLPILSTSSIQRKQIFLSILAFSVPASSLCWSSTWSNAFFVKITEVLPTLFSAKTSELTQLFKTFPIRQTTKLKH